MKTSAPINQIGVAEPLILAVDNGGTNTRVMLRQGEVEVRSVEYPTPHEYEAAVVSLAQTAFGLSGGLRVQAVGLAVAGEIVEGSVKRAGELANYGWVNKQPGRDLAAELGIDQSNAVVLNDCVAAANAQEVVNRRSGEEDSGYVMTISTGVGGAGFLAGRLIPDEPGHEFLRSGMACSCGKEGCVEAHIGGAGISRKFFQPAERVAGALWKGIIIPDAVKAITDLINRLNGMCFEPAAIHFFGSVALKSPYLLPGLKEGLLIDESTSRLPYIPAIKVAYYKDRSGIVGAGDAAAELLDQS